MNARMRGVIGAASVALALALIGSVVAYQPAGAGPAQFHAVNHDNHPAAPDAHQAAAIEGQAGIQAASEFRANCRASHRSGNDPIIYPNQTGVSHVHEFFGNRSTNASSTYTSLKAAGTTCDPVVDLSAYWVPTLYKNGQPVAPESVTVYYQGIHDMQRAVPYPPNMRYVVGNARATSPDQNPSARWSCTTQSPSSRDFMNCPAGTKLETYLDFPTCWNGRDLDSANHKDHIVFWNGSCPSTHNVVLPRLEFLITYPVNGGGLSLGGTVNGANVTTAPGYTFHGDFINAWDQPELERRVRNCVNAGRICGTNGNPI